MITAIDTHDIMPPAPATSIVSTSGHVFNGVLNGALSSNVNILGQPAATLDSTATNNPPHVPIGGTFVKPPSNKGKIAEGSRTVSINKKPAARSGDAAETCNDPVDLANGRVQTAGNVTVFIGD